MRENKFTLRHNANGPNNGPRGKRNIVGSISVGGPIDREANGHTVLIRDAR